MASLSDRFFLHCRIRRRCTKARDIEIIAAFIIYLTMFESEQLRYINMHISTVVAA
jgi:hypothetical protein